MCSFAWGFKFVLCGLYLFSQLMAGTAWAQTVPETESANELDYQNVQILELSYSEPLTLALEGVLAAESSDPDKLRLELADGRLTLTALRTGSLMLYVTQAQGLSLFQITITAPPNRQRKRPFALPSLRRNPNQPAGSISLSNNLPLADASFSPQLSLNYLLEYGELSEGYWLARLNSQNNFNPNFAGLKTSNLNGFNLTYQNPASLLSLGQTGIWNQLSPLAPGTAQFLGGQWTQQLEASQYQVFGGIPLRPLYLYGGALAPKNTQPWLAGSTGQWQIPLAEDGSMGTLNLQALGLVQQDSQQLGGRLITGLNWNLNQNLGAQFLLGGTPQSWALQSSANFRHQWGREDQFLLAGLYRHQEPGFTQQIPLSQDLLNLRLSSSFGSGWGLSGGSSLLFREMQLFQGQGNLRLNRRFLQERLQLYAQASAGIQPGRQQLEFKLAGLARALWPISGYYSWLLRQQAKQAAFQIHLLQLQTQLWDFNYGKLLLLNQLMYQPAHALQPNTLSETINLQFYAALSQNWQLRGSLGYRINQVINEPRGASQALNGTLALNYLPTPIHQFNLQLGYQYLFNNQPHLLNLSLGYQWRYGYEVLGNPARCEGLVFVDHNGNGKPDPSEPGIEGVQLKLGENEAQSSPDGHFRFENLSPGEYTLELERDTLPLGYQSLEQQPVLRLQSGDNPQTLVPLRNEILVSGILFSSPQMAGGLDGIEILLDGEPVATSAWGGRYQFRTRPGKHTLVLDPLSIPTGYRLEGFLSQEIESQHNLQVNFIFVPLISLQLQFLQTVAGPPSAGLELEISQTGAEAQHLQTDSQGSIELTDILPGELTITTAQCQVWRLEIPQQPGLIRRSLLLTEAHDEAGDE